MKAYMHILDEAISTIWVAGTMDETASSRRLVPAERFVHLYETMLPPLMARDILGWRTRSIGVVRETVRLIKDE